MKEELFEILLSIFEHTISQLKRKKSEEHSDSSQEKFLFDAEDSHPIPFFQYPSSKAMRVVTLEEQIKLTKPALQFLTRLMHTHMLSAEQFEQVMQDVIESEARYVCFSEVHHIVHQVLSQTLSYKDLLMLELAFDVEMSAITMH